MIHAKLIYATLAGGIVYFLLGWLLYGILFMDFFMTNSIYYEGLTKEMPNLPLMFLSNLVMSFLLAFILDHWARHKTFAKGFFTGLFITFFFALSIDLMFYSTMNLYEPSGLLVDILIISFMGGISGGIMGWILGLGKRTA